MTTKIRFSRESEIHNSRAAAMICLRENKSFVEGEPVIIKYKNPDEDRIDALFAIGTKEGRGDNCFSLISSGEFVTVEDVRIGDDNIPTVTECMDGQYYLWQRNNGEWNYVYGNSDLQRREVEPITTEPITFISLLDHNIWVSDNNKQVRCLNLLYSQAEIDKMIEEIKREFDVEEIKERLSAVEVVAARADAKTVDLQDQINQIEKKGTSIGVIARVHNKLNVSLVSVNNVDRTSPWFFKEGNEDYASFVSNALEFKVVYTAYDGNEYTTGTEEDPDFIIKVNDHSDWLTYDPVRKTYKLNQPIAFDDITVDTKLTLHFWVSFMAAAKEFDMDLYHIIGQRAFSRVNDTSDETLINAVKTLSPDRDYIWGSLQKKSGLEFTEGDNSHKFIAYMYPKIWGELDQITMEPFILYDKLKTGLTFEKKEIEVSFEEPTVEQPNPTTISYLAYVYSNPNITRAINLNFE